jgi:septal ring factor EnvC (AmiA/AmiB activator)
LTDLQEQQKKQQEEFNKSLGQMQEVNKTLQSSITQTTNELMASKQRVTELESHKPNNTGYIIAIIILAILALIGLFT